MSKTPLKLENPRDLFYLNLCNKTSAYFYKYGFTPNMIITISLLCT